MTAQFKSLLTMMFLVLLFSCEEEKKAGYLDEAPVVARKVMVGGEELIELNPALLKDTVEFPLSYFTDDLEIIKLDDREEALVNAYRVLASENYFLTMSSNNISCKLFDRQGRYICDIGAIGQGPGEYRYLYSGQIDEVNNRIYLCHFSGESVLVYDLEGNILNPVPLPQQTFKPLIQVDGDEILIMSLPHPTVTSPIWMQNLKGDILYEIPSSNLNFEFDYSTEIFSHRNLTGQTDISFWTWTARTDTLFHLDLQAKGLLPRFTADFKGEALQPHMYYELPDYYLGNTSTIVTVSRQTEEGGLETYKEGKEPAYYIVDKNSLKGTYYHINNDFLGGERANPFPFINGYMIECVDPGNLEERIEKALESGQLTEKNRARLTEVLENMTVNDNNYLLYAKMKK